MARLILSKRSLETFYGIGPKVSQRIMARFHIQPWAKVGSLKNSTVLELTTELSEMKIENDLRREVQENIRRLKDMGTYRGRRHAMGLPVRGQRTRTQVRRKLRDRGNGTLTAVDCNGKAIEQDRTRWLWANTGLKKSFIACNCNIMYNKHGARPICSISRSKPHQIKNFAKALLFAQGIGEGNVLSKCCSFAKVGQMRCVGVNSMCQFQKAKIRPQKSQC